MSWASHRQTSRTEDIAYCLFGIFDVNIPLIYGEGRNAFRRLQEAIMLKTYDQSLFAWGRLVDSPSELIHAEQALGFASIPWKPPKERLPLLGLFADTPESFKSSRDISPVDHRFAHTLNRHHPPSLLSGGDLLDLVISKTEISASHWDRPIFVRPSKLDIAVLLCQIGAPGGKPAALALRRWGDGYYGRTPELVVTNISVSNMRFQRLVRQRHVMSERPAQLRNGDIIFRQDSMPFQSRMINRSVTTSGPAWRIRESGDCTILRVADDAVGSEDFRFNYELDPLREDVAISFRRLSESMNPIGPLLVEAFPINFRNPSTEEERRWFNLVPEKPKQDITPEDLDSGFGLTPQFEPPTLDQIHSHEMRTPSGSWALEVGGLPRICVKVERMLLDEGRNGAVDVIDFFMYPDGPLAAKARRSIGLGDHE